MFLLLLDLNFQPVTEVLEVVLFVLVRCQSYTAVVVELVCVLEYLHLRYLKLSLNCFYDCRALR